MSWNSSSDLLLWEEPATRKKKECTISETRIVPHSYICIKSIVAFWQCSFICWKNVIVCNICWLSTSGGHLRLTTEDKVKEPRLRGFGMPWIEDVGGKEKNLREDLWMLWRMICRRLVHIISVTTEDGWRRMMGVTGEMEPPKASSQKKKKKKILVNSKIWKLIQNVHLLY